MKYDFDTLVEREGLDSVKALLTPAEITSSGHITMWGAEFDFRTAPFVTEAITEWASRGIYPYTIDTDRFRRLVARWMKTHRKWDVEPEWVVTTYGISSSLAIAARAFLEQGDKILCFEPGYDNYWCAVERCGRKRIGSRMKYTGEGYEIDWRDLEHKMADPSCKMIVLCNPQNPTGQVFSDEEIAGIATAAVRNDVIIFSDEIFAECLYEGHISAVEQVCPEAKVITATSIGKWLSFTGTNHANIIISDPEIRSRFIEERNATFYGSVNPMMIPAYEAAYTSDGEDWIHELMTYVRGNYKLVCDYFRRIKGFKVMRPEGTYILWVDASEFCCDEDKLRSFLIGKAHFHVDMGTQYYGDPGFFRMNLAMPRAELEKNLKSLVDAILKNGQNRYE